MAKERIEMRFRELKEAKRAGLITYIMAGDPDAETSASIMQALPGMGADIIELGFPFSDPSADGPTIEAAGQRALAKGMSLKKSLDIVKQFRKKDQTTPVILMGYYNPVAHYGVNAFTKDAVDAGVDGIILVDLPPEEEEEFTQYSKKTGLALVRLASPTTDDTRAPNVFRHAEGFVYYISVAGITGVKSANISEVEASVAALRVHTQLPIAVGFGIKTPEQAKTIGKFADAIVVGSAIVEKIQQYSKNDSSFNEKLNNYVQSLANALRSDRAI